jgi:RNA polymerase sigma-70 factor, ECF subfamily
VVEQKGPVSSWNGSNESENRGHVTEQDVVQGYPAQSADEEPDDQALESALFAQPAPIEPAAIDDALKVPLSNDAETELFNKFLAGSDEAYRKLYDAYERQLYIYCCRLLANETEAQDVFQDIWIRMFRLRGEKATVKKFSGLLFTVARNLSLNAIRDKKALRSGSIEELNQDSAPFIRASEREEEDMREMMQKALQQLPFTQREAFVLREYSGYSYQEIAEITGATMINVKTRAWRARERLRKIIGAWLELKS